MPTFSRLELANGYGLIRASIEDTRESLLVAAASKKVEGWVLKHGGQYGKWYKLKRENTVDCVVTNIIPGKGKFANMAGAVARA